MIRQDTVRRLARAAPEYAALVTHTGSAALQEPLLHAWLSQDAPTVTLEQLLFGYLRPIDRPPRIQVQASPNGVVHLPCLGALHTGMPRASFELRWNLGAPLALWSAEGRRVPVTFTPRQVVPGTTIELHTELPPLCARFLHRSPAAEELEEERTAARSLPALTRALALLARVAPEQRSTLERDCRALLLVRSDTISSLTTMDACGLAVLSVPEGPSEIYFCEDLLHQVGHLSFFAITVQRCFTIPAATPLAHLAARKDDPRTLYAAFHDNYATMRMVQFFDACLTAGAVRGELRHELIGRLALALDRYRDGLEAIDDQRIYTPMAWDLHCRMAELHEEVRGRRGPLLRQYDLASQPHSFDYGVFCAHNPRFPDAVIGAGGIPL